MGCDLFNNIYLINYLLKIVFYKFTQWNGLIFCQSKIENIESSYCYFFLKYLAYVIGCLLFILSSIWENSGIYNYWQFWVFYGWFII
jgi:hypothetical protein